MVHTRSTKEIEKIAASCQIVADTLIMLKPHIVEGVCVSDLDTMAEEYILSRGARPAFKGYMGFPSTLCISIPTGISCKGRQLPTLISILDPFSILSPTLIF